MSDVITDIQDGVIIVTINRPEAKNAMTKSASEGILAAMQQLDSDSSLNAAIITGAGGSFCSGMDLKGFLKGESPSIKGYGFGGMTIKGPEKPVIAAIEGYALAGGMELAIACDMRVANSKAQFGIPETKRGLVAGAGGLLHLAGIVGKGVAMELALTGDFIDAKRAYEIGFVNRLTDGDALEEAMKLATSVAANGPMALKITKNIINSRPDWTSETMWDEQQKLLTPVFTSEDAREGAAAFAEKRKPVWTGK